MVMAKDATNFVHAHKFSDECQIAVTKRVDELLRFGANGVSILPLGFAEAVMPTIFVQTPCCGRGKNNHHDTEQNVGNALIDISGVSLLPDAPTQHVYVGR